MREKYMPLKINGIDDKEGYIAVYEARQNIKKVRVGVGKTCKEILEDAIKFQKIVKGKAAEYTDKLIEIEKHLQSEEDVFEAEKQRIKEEKARQEQIKLQDKINQLMSYGLVFNGLAYVMTFKMNHPDIGADKVEVDLLDLKDMKDEVFNGLISRIKQTYETEQAYLAKIEREKAEEAARQELARKAVEEHAAKEKAEYEVSMAAEREYMRKQQEAIEAKMAEQAEAQRKLDEAAREQEEQTAKLKAEQERLEEEKRKIELKKLADAQALQEEDEKNITEEEIEDSFVPVATHSKTDDKTKLNVFMASLNEITVKVPLLNSDEAKGILAKALDDIDKIITDIEIGLEKLK